jgi:toxin ParE1/3/4
MRIVRLSPLARSDIAGILNHSEGVFGSAAAARYGSLLLVATRDLAKDPDRPGVRRREELGPGYRTYHVQHSRGRIGVRHPRHILLFRIGPGTLQVARVLHDSMDLARHLPRNE